MDGTGASAQSANWSLRPDAWRSFATSVSRNSADFRNRFGAPWKARQALQKSSTFALPVLQNSPRKTNAGGCLQSRRVRNIRLSSNQRGRRRLSSGSPVVWRLRQFARSTKKRDPWGKDRAVKVGDSLKQATRFASAGRVVRLDGLVRGCLRDFFRRASSPQKVIGSPASARESCTAAKQNR